MASTVRHIFTSWLCETNTVEVIVSSRLRAALHRVLSETQLRCPVTRSHRACQITLRSPLQINCSSLVSVLFLFQNMGLNFEFINVLASYDIY